MKKMGYMLLSTFSIHFSILIILTFIFFPVFNKPITAKEVIFCFGTSLSSAYLVYKKRKKQENIRQKNSQ